MKTKVNDLTDAQLDELCARAHPGWMPHYSADGWELLAFDTGHSDRHGCRFVIVKEYHPTSNDAQVMELVKEFHVHIYAHNDPITGEFTHWETETFPLNTEDYALYRTQYDYSLNRAICKAVVASVFGDEVEVEQ